MAFIECKEIVTPFGLPLFFRGPELSQGPLPAFFYFALAGDESLTLPPYNHPVLVFDNSLARTFSFTLPYHGPNFNRHHAMQAWIQSLYTNSFSFEPFFEAALASIEWLIDSNYVDPSHIATGGLSRGGFIATHLAAREKRIKSLLGFAPLTTLQTLSENHPFSNEDPTFSQKLKSLSLSSIASSLIHLQNLRFYIGNRDTRVGTDNCYLFIKNLTQLAYENRARHCHIELFITHSIGQHGHGTAPHIFEEGAQWLKNTLGKK